MDDIEFENNVDLEAEFGGIEDDAAAELRVQGNADLEINFSDEGSDKDSDMEEEKEYNLPTFKGKSELSSPKFCIGLTFGSKQDFKDAIYNYAMCN